MIQGLDPSRGAEAIALRMHSPLSGSVLVRVNTYRQPTFGYCSLYEQAKCVIISKYHVILYCIYSTRAADVFQFFLKTSLGAASSNDKYVCSALVRVRVPPYRLRQAKVADGDPCTYNYFIPVRNNRSTGSSLMTLLNLLSPIGWGPPSSRPPPNK